MRNITSLTFIVLQSVLYQIGFAQIKDSVKVYLWEKDVPLAIGSEETDKPSVTVYFPEKPNEKNSAVLICPGGGYVALAMDHEGLQVARWFAQRGIVAIVLKYRLGTWDSKKYRYPTQLLDVKRAMRLVRSKSKNWSIDPERIGVMGFSAGGHLASCLSTMFDGGQKNAKDPVERWSCRPAFSILVYPVISFRSKHGFSFSRGVLLGEMADPALVDSLSTELRVTPYTPPTFIIHAYDDNVRVENSLLYFMALREHNVPAELHVYERGGHGFGINPLTSKAPNPDRIADWPIRLENFLKNRGIVLP